MDQKFQKLVFVYNADSGLFNTISDIAHKILSPETYSCRLCALTHGYFTIRDSWVKFLQQLDIEHEFLHRNEAMEKYKIKNPQLPVIYIIINNQPEIWLSKQEIEAFEDIDSFILFIKQKLTI